MTAVVWGVFGLLAATLGILASAVFAAFHRLDGRFDSVHEDLREVRGDLRDLRNAVVDLDHRLTTAGG